MKNERKVYYMALGANGCRWEECKQLPLFCTWHDAVATCKLQQVATRLSESEGFRNQGHYFQPEQPTIMAETKEDVLNYVKSSGHYLDIKADIVAEYLEGK